nr:MAG TPA: hypothetical protein [Caudoviricetes sp.]
MTYEEIKEKYSLDKSGYIYCSDCPLCIFENDEPSRCLGYDDFCDGYGKAYARIQKYLSDKENLSDKKNTAFFYVDWKNKEILNEHKYNEMIKELEYDNDNKFFDWLNERYSASDIFKMDEDDRKDVANEFLAEYKKRAKEKCDCYERVEVEL